ncbi:MAG: helix-turn-helix domain-containing protein [Cytophagaceae bacterium]|nr:helix-turn-helix domain-containing protein [Cytophagaceae bacterium]
MNLNDKIKHIISDRNLTPSYFADEIGVQRSSISHILSGRNRPSLEIIQKVVTRFPDLTYEWLLSESDLDDVVGQSSPTPVLRHSMLPNRPEVNPSSAKLSESPRRGSAESIPVHPTGELQPVATSVVKSVEKILIFYSDKTFTEYKPA